MTSLCGMKFAQYRDIDVMSCQAQYWRQKFNKLFLVASEIGKAFPEPFSAFNISQLLYFKGLINWGNLWISFFEKKFFFPPFFFVLKDFPFSKKPKKKLAGKKRVNLLCKWMRFIHGLFESLSSKDLIYDEIFLRILNLNPGP